MALTTSFSNIQGHQLQKQQLLNAIKINRLSPVLIFSGPSGVGKSRLAYELAQIITCETRMEGDTNACHKCGSCLRALKNQSESILVVSPDGAQIKVEQSRSIIDFLSLQKISRARVIIINEAEKLAPASANALLKTLEEPPSDVFFILITNGISSLLSTIRSRAQILRFGTLNHTELSQLSDAMQWMVRASLGQMDRLESLRSEESRSALEVAYESWEKMRGGNPLGKIKELSSDRMSTKIYLSFWEQILRDLTVRSQGAQDFIHEDLLARIPLQLTGHQIESLWAVYQRAERDFDGNIDRGLALESLWLKSRAAIMGS